MNKTPAQLLAQIKTIIEGIDYNSYGIENVRQVYDYPTALIPKFPAVMLEMNNCQRVDESLGDGRYVEYYTVVITGYISFFDTRQNYLDLIQLDVALKTTLKAAQVTSGYWRNSDPPNSDYSISSISDNLVRRVQLTWMIQNVTIP